MNRPVTFAAIVITSLLAAAGAARPDDGAVMFRGYDPLWQAPTIVVRRDGRYYMDGAALDELRHRNMPAGGISLAIRDRRGAPDIYFLIRDRAMEIYVDCEFGPCRFKRSITRSR